MNAISHVAIGVRDMERSLRFYRDLLGLEVMSDQTQPIGNMPTLYANRKRASAEPSTCATAMVLAVAFWFYQSGREERRAKLSSWMKSGFLISRGGSMICARFMTSSKAPRSRS